MNAILAPMSPVTRLLIVDDDAGIRDVIASFLGRNGFRVDTAADPSEMRRLLGRDRYDLVVLDLMMPVEDGLTALRQLLRDGGPPVIMLSAVGSDIDRIVGLEVGAEDYLAKPCNPRELLARIRTVLRRAAGRAAGDGHWRERAAAAVPAANADAFRFGEWRLELHSRQLHDPAGRSVTLSDGEFRLLRAFLQHPRRVLTRNQLLDYSLGTASEAYDRAIDVQISRLRRKLTDRDERVDLIRTVRAEGYMFMLPVTRMSA